MANWRKTLYDLGVRRLHGEFSGSGDEGYMNEVTFLDEGGIVMSTVGWPEDAVKDADQYLDDAANKSSVDWVNNEGGFGTVDVDLETGDVTLDVSWYEQSVGGSETDTFELPEDLLLRDDDLDTALDPSNDPSNDNIAVDA